MKIKELKAAIADLPDDMQVIIQKDGEGNGFSPLEGVDADAVYVPNSPWSGEVFDTNWTADDACMDEGEWDRLMAKPRCLILYPVN